MPGELLHASAIYPCASVTMAQVSAAIALARSPAFIENSNITCSRAGERVVARYPKIVHSWIGLTIVACLPCLMAPQWLQSTNSYEKSLET